MPTIVRDATASDMARVTEIFNSEGVATTACYDYDPFDEAHWLAWFDAQTVAGRPCLVAEIDGRVVGFADYTPFRPKEGWAFTVENSCYVDSSAKSNGVGTALMEALLARAAADGKHVMVAVIDADNEVSQHFHARLGFELMGIVPEGGRKFGRWLNVAFWVRQLG